jgi:hypothetical protein
MMSRKLLRSQERQLLWGRGRTTGGLVSQLTGLFALFPLFVAESFYHRSEYLTIT